MAFDWKKTVATVAPLLGAAIGGPLAPIASAAIIAALGLPQGSAEEQVEAAVAKATPAQLLALKKADQDFRKTMRELDIKEDEIHAGDRASARDQYKNLGGDSIVKSLAIITAVAFAAMVGYLLSHGLPEGIDRTFAGILVGYAAALVQQVFNFYFGSSKGSHDKTWQLSQGGKA